MDTEMTPAESLKLIESMIGQAKRSFHRMSFYFLMWGVLLIAAMALNLAFAHVRSPLVSYVWGVAGILGGAISMIHGMREGKRQRVESPMDAVIMWLWAAFVATMLITMIGAGVSGYQTPVSSIIVLTGLPTFVTGRLMKFPPLILGGILFWVVGAISFFVPPEVLAWLYIGVMLFGYVVPGYMLKRQEDALRTA